MDDLLTQSQSATITRLLERTLERHRCAGTGPKFVRLGRRVFYRRADLDAWIADCTYGSTSEADMRAAQRLARAATKNADWPKQRPENPRYPHPPLAEKATPVESAEEDARSKNGKFPAVGLQLSESWHHGVAAVIGSAPTGDRA